MKLALTTWACGLTLLCGTAGATTINFDDLAEGTLLSTQYSALGVTFAANAFSGPGNSSSGSDWASNTDMTITATDIGGLGAPSLVSGKLLHSFGGWLAEDGDASFWINFSAPVNTISLDFAGISTAADVRLFVYNGATLLSTVAATGTGQKTLSFAAASITKVAVAPGSFNDWVGVDNLNFTPSAVPEPASYALLALGLGAFSLLKRRGVAAG